MEFSETAPLDHHADTRNTIGGITVSFWRELLYTASVFSQEIALKYTGMDFGLDAHPGPVWLEVNDQPGLRFRSPTGNDSCRG